MSQSLNSVILAGGTGLVGSNILKTLIDLPTQPQIHALTRKSLRYDGPKCIEVKDADSSKWPQQIRDIQSAPNAFMTALGTTRAQAGSFEAQRRIDFDLNLAMAKASKESGSRIGVLISSTGTSAKSIMPYSKLKGETELAFKDVGFEYTIILRPGLLMGQRDDSRPAEAILRKVAGGLGAISSHLIDFWAQDSAVIARAAVSAALQCAESKREDPVWVLEQADIIRLGRTDWKAS